MALDLKRGTRDRDQNGDRVPPGQRVTEGFPILTYGTTPKVEASDWRLAVAGEVEEERWFTWNDLQSLPQVTLQNDIHCVTGWSKLDNSWVGVPFPELARQIRLKPEANFAMAHSHGGYTTNLSIADLMRDDVLIAHTHNGEPLAAEHGGPVRLVVPHLYFWKSAKWLRGFVFMMSDEPGFWEQYGYHIHGDPWQEERYA